MEEFSCCVALYLCSVSGSSLTSDLKGQVWIPHCAAAAPAFTRPSSPSQFIVCSMILLPDLPAWGKNCHYLTSFGPQGKMTSHGPCTEFSPPFVNFCSPLLHIRQPHNVVHLHETSSVAEVCGLKNCVFNESVEVGQIRYLGHDRSFYLAAWATLLSALSLGHGVHTMSDGGLRCIGGVFAECCLHSAIHLTPGQCCAMDGVGGIGEERGQLSWSLPLPMAFVVGP